MDTSTFVNRKGQRIDATYHPAPHPRYLALLGHGVTGNKDRPLMVGIASELADRGVPSLRFSFAGNGKSGGKFEKATITSETEDLVDILKLVASLERHIIYIGHSMGGAVGCLVAAQEPERIQTLVSLAGMVETGAFFRREFADATPGEGFMWGEPSCPLSQEAWDDALQIDSTLPAARVVTQPWLFFHGTDDDLVPIADSHAAVKAATTRTKLIERAGEGHMFSEAAYPEIAKAIIEWL